MAMAAKKYQDAIYNWLVSIFKEGLAKGEFHFTDTPEDHAHYGLATLPGAIQAAQTRGKDYFNKYLDKLIRSWSTIKISGLIHSTPNLPALHSRTR